MSKGEIRFSGIAGPHRRFFIGGSDARIIMGNDEDALLRLWREKRGEAEPEDLSGNLIVQPTVRLLFGAEYVYGSLERKNDFKWVAPRLQASVMYYINKYPQ